MRINTSHRSFVAVSAVALVASLASCADDDAIIDDPETAVTEAVADVEQAAGEAIEVAARNAASQLAPEQFAAEGHPLEGGLTCTADAADSLTSADVECLGTTADGGQAELTGTMTDLPDEVVLAVEGRFVGTVDGEQVFDVSRLGN